jgi:hypothetical protein
MARLIIIISLVLVSCQKTFLGKDPSSTPQGNFEFLWKTVDEKYSFFSYKRINWDSVYQVYAPKVSNNMTDIQLFDIMFKMLAELRDAHVNLISPFNISGMRCIQPKPVNFDSKLLTYYLGSVIILLALFASAFARWANWLYTYASFSDDVSGSDVDFMLTVLRIPKE